MKRRTKIFLISISALFLAFAIFFSWKIVQVGEDYRLSLNNVYTRSLGEFAENLEEMELALNKAKYTATSSGQNMVAINLSQSAGAAKSALSYLPFNDDNSQTIEKSLSVIADFALYIENKISKSQNIDDKDYENFQILHEHIKAIKENIEQIRSKVENNELSIGGIDSLVDKSFAVKSLPNFDENISELSKELSAMPTMIYDGPFSDHIKDKEPTFLKDKKEISEEEAQKIASDFAKVEKDSLKLKYVDQGNLASYQFEGEDISIKVSIKGGEIIYFKKSKDISENNLSYEDALEMSLKHLKEAGYDNLKESYYVINDNLCTINFAPLQDDVIMYPDLIKVTVELGEGEMFEFNATGYLSNHHERKKIIPTLDEAVCSQSVSKILTIKNINIATVPTASLNESLCYEFLCQDNESKNQVLVYINGETGLEEQIFIVLESETGKMVM